MTTGDSSTPGPGEYPPSQPAGLGGQADPYPAAPASEGPTAPYPASSGPLVATTAEERNWALGAHLSAIVGAWLFLGFIGPLVVLLIQGNRGAFVRAHTVEALNFNLSILLYAIVGGVLTFILVGFVVLAAVGILWLVCTVLASIKASHGESYRYPLTIRLVH
jgi:uncharacterized protein